ncbi:hypothetical protein KPH14_001047 [Odynerus spinipes]|uniref:Uncharacterized protein n=1 Tax=Odynerus spinipes TaxID=1348599 RepID=A0AAD9R947_9HYME|nr:hypothetical protein KPH14_001047 [Odynerus spinipes]
MTERSLPSRKIKRCKTALCKAASIPLSTEYGDRTLVKATAAESNGQPHVRSARWKEIRTAKNSVVSKLFKKEAESSENDDDDVELAESLGKNLESDGENYETYPTDRRLKEKSGKFVCYCQKEDCPGCRLAESKKGLVGSIRNKENVLGRDKFKKNRYHKLLPSDYAIPKIPLVRLPELYREIPYDSRRNRGNAKKMEVLPIVRGIPSNVHPLTVPFRVAYDPADSYVGDIGPVAQQYQQQLNNNYQQYMPLKQYAIASKSKSDIPRRPGNNVVGSRNNDDRFSTTTSYPKKNRNDDDLNSEEDFEDDSFDPNMQECIKLFGRKVCVLAASANCDKLNQMKGRGDSRFFIESNKNVGSARNYYESSSTEQSSAYYTDDYYDVTESDVTSEENINDHRISTEQSFGSYYDDYYDSTVPDVISETPEYVTIGTDNDRISSDDDYYDSNTPKYVTIDSTEAGILRAMEDQEKNYLSSTTSDSFLTNSVSTDNTEYLMPNPEDESSTYTSETTNNNNYDNLRHDFGSTTTKIEDGKSTDTILGTIINSENESSTYSSRDENNNSYDNLFEHFTSTTTKIEDEESTGTELTLDDESSTYRLENDNNDNNYDDFTSSTTRKIVDEKSTDTILGAITNSDNEFSTYASDGKNNNCNNLLHDDFASTTTKIEDDKATETILTSENESSTYNSYNENNNYYDDLLYNFPSTTTEIGDESSVDTLVGNDRTHYIEETHPGLDYSDIQVVTNSYFTSKGYDNFDENYFTGLDPSAYDDHLPENPPSYDPKVGATNIPAITKDGDNSQEVLPTKSYLDFAKGRVPIDSTMKNNLDIDETTVQDDVGLLEKEQTNCKNAESNIEDPGKEAALKSDKLDQNDSFLGDTDHVDTWDRSTISFETTTPIELTENGEVATIDDYTVGETILTTTEKNSLELRTPEDSTAIEGTTTTATKGISDENLDPIVGFPDESVFSEPTDPVTSVENFSQDFDTTSNPLTDDDSEIGESEKDNATSNNFEIDSTTPRLPFCDNTILVNSIRKVINNFTMDSSSPEDPYIGMGNANEEELSPEIREIPNLRTFLSLPVIENVIVKKVKHHLIKYAGVPENALAGTRPRDMIRNTLRNILGVLPKTQPELPPMTVIEHKFQNDQWTTNLVTLVPVEPSEETRDQNSLQRIHDHVKDLIYNPAIGLEAAKQNAVQNIIVQAVKHQMENTNDEEIGEDTIRDMVGSVLGDAYEPNQNEDEKNNFENSSTMEDTTKGLDYTNNYDETTTEIIFSTQENEKNDTNEFTDFHENFEQITIGIPVTNNLVDIEPTTASFTESSSSEDLIKSVQSSSTEISEKDNESSDDPNLGEERSRDYANRVQPEQVTITIPVTNNSDDIESTTVSEFSSTEISEKDNESSDDPNLGEERSRDYANRVQPEQVTITIPVTNNSDDIESTTVSEFSSTEISEKNHDSNCNPNLGEERSRDYANRVQPEQVTITIPVTNNSDDIESTTVSEFSSTEISEKDNESSDGPNLGEEQSDSFSNYTQDNFSTTESYTTNIEDDHLTESMNGIETTSMEDVRNINEETTVGVSYEDRQQFAGTTEKNKGETNESEVLRLPQNSFVGAGNTGIGESSSANQGQSSLGKEKCRLCKIESCTSTHEIVTKVHKRVKTTTKKYYGAKENVASEENPIVSSKHQEEDRSTVVSSEEKENRDVKRSNNGDDDVSTTCENLSDEKFRDSESDEDIVYKEKISRKKTNDDENDDFSDLQNSELYYVGDNVKLPLEIKKLKDGSYALSISKSICENVLKKKCPCCVPLEGNVRSVRRTPKINDNTDRVSNGRKSMTFPSKPWRQRPRRSAVPNKTSNWDNSVVKNELETMTMPVVTFAKKYNLRLNLDDLEIGNRISDQSKRIDEIDKDNIDIGSRKRLIERPNEITRDENKFEERNDIYRNDDDRVEKIERDMDNPIFQRMKFVNKMQKNPELYRHQRAIEESPNGKTEIIKNLLNWFRMLILD